jgi:HK97 gp10 family phage protein
VRVDIDSSELVSIAHKLKDKPLFQKAMEPVFHDAIMDYKALAFSDAPNDKGQLARSIHQMFYGENKLNAEVGILDRSCPYAKFVYFGTKDSPNPIRPKNINPKTGKIFRSLFFEPVKNGGFIFRGSAKHKGQKANPFLLNTWNRNYPEFVKTLNEGLTEIIEMETKP